MGKAGKAGIAAAAGILVGYIGMRLASRDIPQPQDADLFPAVVPAADADNGYPVFLKLQAAFPLSLTERALIGKRLDGGASDADAAAVDALISRSTEAAALFADFSRRSTFQDPAYRDPSAVGPETPVPQMGSFLALAKILSLRAESLLNQGRAPEALALTLSIVDAGRALTRSRSPLIPQMVGMLLLNVGSKRAMEIAASGKLDSARLRAAALRLSVPTESAAGLQDALRYEYAANMHVLVHLPETSAKSAEGQSEAYRLALFTAAKNGNYFYLPNRTRALFAARYRQLVAAAGEPCLRSRLPPFEVLPMRPWPNMVGRIIYSVAIPQFEKMSVRRCEADFRLTAAAAGAALQAYRLDHGRYPASLAELTPDYLPAAPVDAYTAAAPLYSAAAGEIHSAGKDSDGKPL